MLPSSLISGITQKQKSLLPFVPGSVCSPVTPSMFVVPPVNAECSASVRGLWGSNVTLFGHDNCPGVPSPRRNLTGTDSKPIQSYLGPQGNLPLITIVADVEISVHHNWICWDSHSFLRLHCEFPILVVLVWGRIARFPHYFTYQTTLVSKMLGFRYASVCQGLSIHLSKGNTHP